MKIWDFCTVHNHDSAQPILRTHNQDCAHPASRQYVLYIIYWLNATLATRTLGCVQSLFLVARISLPKYIPNASPSLNIKIPRSNNPKHYKI